MDFGEGGEGAGANHTYVALVNYSLVGESRDCEAMGL